MTEIPPPPAYGSVPVAPAVTGTYASWLSRVGAYLLDQLVVSAVAIPLLAPGLVVLFMGLASAEYDEATATMTGGDPSPAAIGLLVLGYLGFIAFSIWNVVIRQGRTGQSLGKKWVGIKVVREATGDVPGIWLNLGRVLLLSVLSAVTLYLNLLWPLWDAKKQTLHDKVVSTVVIRVP